MRTFLATALGILVATLSLAGVGQAQGLTAVQGTIQGVDCRTNSLFLNSSNGTEVFPAGPYTAVFVNSAPVSLCALQQYVGSSATVSVAASGNQLVAERVDVYAGAAQASVYPAPAPAPAPSYSGVPSWLGVAIGAVAVGGLLYLLVRGHDGNQYRYPYNGYYNGRYYTGGRYNNAGYNGGYNNAGYNGGYNNAGYNGGYNNGGYYNGGYNGGYRYAPRPGFTPECRTRWQQNCRELNHGN